MIKSRWWRGFLVLHLLMASTVLHGDAAIAWQTGVNANGVFEVEQRTFDPVDESRKRTVPIRVYFPAAEGPTPVVLFSHGLGGSRENNAYLGTHWASHGYTCVFIQHIGSDTEVWRSAARGQVFQALKNAANVQSTKDRLMDVSFVIDTLQDWNKSAEHPFYQKLDLGHIGMCGHSFGAVTTLGIAGRKYPLQRGNGDDRIAAFLPMSPQPGKGLSPQRAFGHLAIPILCMTGSEDRSPIDPTLQPEDRRKVYQALPAGDKYQLVLEGAEHSAFGDGRGLRARRRNPNHHPAIQKISTKFWDAYLKEDAVAKSWLQSDQPRQTCKLDPKDGWEWK